MRARKKEKQEKGRSKGGRVCLEAKRRIRFSDALTASHRVYTAGHTQSPSSYNVFQFHITEMNVILHRKKIQSEAWI